MHTKCEHSATFHYLWYDSPVLPCKSTVLAIFKNSDNSFDNNIRNLNPFVTEQPLPCTGIGRQNEITTQNLLLVC